ncbi:hypothetical protein KA005_49565 [bacterium]|nr:hypothetical protein [bacterium]
MRHFFYVLGYWQERRRWSETVYDLRHKKDLLLADYGHEIVMAGLEGLGFLYVRDNKKYETAITIAEDANKIIERIGKNANGTYKSKDWKRAKCFYYRMKGISERNDYRAAADCLEKAYDLAGESDWESMKVAIGINLGVSYLDLERVDDAIKLFEESEKLALETTPRLHRRRVNALIGIGNAKTTKLVKEYGNAGWNSKNIREAASHFKNAWEVDTEYVQDEPYLFVNIAKGVSKLLSHVEGVNIMLENLEKKTTDLENCKKSGNWNLRDFTKIRKQTNGILNTIFKYLNV